MRASRFSGVLADIIGRNVCFKNTHAGSGPLIYCALILPLRSSGKTGEIYFSPALGGLGSRQQKTSLYPVFVLVEQKINLSTFFVTFSVVVSDAGQLASEPGMIDALVAASDDFCAHYSGAKK